MFRISHHTWKILILVGAALVMLLLAEVAAAPMAGFTGLLI